MYYVVPWNLNAEDRRLCIQLMSPERNGPIEATHLIRDAGLLDEVYVLERIPGDVLYDRRGNHAPNDFQDRPDGTLSQPGYGM